MQIIAHCILFVSNITEKDDLMHVLSVTFQYLLPLVENMVFQGLYFRQIRVPDMNNLSAQYCVAEPKLKVYLEGYSFVLCFWFCFVFFFWCCNTGNVIFQIKELYQNFALVV